MTPIKSHIMLAEEFTKTAQATVELIEEGKLKGNEAKMGLYVIETTIQKAKEQIIMAKLYTKEH